MHQHVAVVLGQGERCLAFEIEMFLPANVDLAGQTLGGGLQRALYVAFLIDAGAFLEPAVGGKGGVDAGLRVVVRRSRTAGATIAARLAARLAARYAPARL